MPRPIGFDRDVVLEEAMWLFWRRGYEATSVQNLVEAMGINRASLYANFGTKHALFLAALDRYLARVNGPRLAILRRPGSPRAALGAFFEALTDAVSGEERQLGCLLTNTLTEMAPHDPAIATRLRAALRGVERELAQAVRRGQQAGEIPPGRDPRALSRFLVALVQGMRVLARSGASAQTLREIAAAGLLALA